MPANQLTHIEPLATATLDALATSVLEAADRHNIHHDALAEAVDAFTTAGLAALTASDGERWTQANIALAPGSPPQDVARVLEQLRQHGAHHGWWFLNKPPGWRIRLLDADRTTLARTLDTLRAGGVISGWTWSIYEPETAAFGGERAATSVHDLFCADTRGVLAHLDTSSPIGTKEVSILALTALARGARLDDFETGDVFAKVAAMRPPVPADQADSVRRLGQVLRPHLLARPAPTALAAVAGDHLEQWLSAFHDTGSQLADLAATGVLHRGLRSVLAQVVIFHWNRLSLSGGTQSALACAAVHALLPGDQP